MIGAIEIVCSEFLIVAVICFFLIHYYKGNMVTPDVIVSVYISWVLGLAGTLLLPYDLSLAIVGDVQSKSLETVWSCVYWSTFFLAWIVLPIQMEYHSSGHFTFWNRLKDAITRLAVAGLLSLTAGCFYILYMAFTEGGSFAKILGFMMAMGNTYGVLLITVLMGNGLVALPRRLWMMGDCDQELNRLYISAVRVEEAYQDSRYELEDCEYEVNKLSQLLEKNDSSTVMDRNLNENIIILKTNVSNFNFACRSNTRSLVTTTNHVDYSTEKGMVTLHAKLIKAQLRARACERRWRILVQQCRKNQLSTSAIEIDAAEDLESNWCLMRTEYANKINADCCAERCRASHCNVYVGQCYRFFMTRCYFHVCRLFAVLCGSASCLILWCELVMASRLHSPIGLIMGAYDSSKNTNGDMIIVQFSLGYNFLLCLNINRTDLTAFNNLVKNIQVVPVFGTSFTVYVPIIMVVVSLVTLFNVYRKLLSFLGIECDDDGACCYHSGVLSDAEETKLRTGKAVIASELRQTIAKHQELAKRLVASKRIENPINNVITTQITGKSGKSNYINLQSSPEDDDSSPQGSTDDNNSRDFYDSSTYLGRDNHTFNQNEDDEKDEYPCRVKKTRIVNSLLVGIGRNERPTTNTSRDKQFAATIHSKQHAVIEQQDRNLEVVSNPLAGMDVLDRNCNNINRTSNGSSSREDGRKDNGTVLTMARIVGWFGNSGFSTSKSSQTTFNTLHTPSQVPFHSLPNMTKPFSLSTAAYPKNEVFDFEDEDDNKYRGRYS